MCSYAQNFMFPDQGAKGQQKHLLEDNSEKSWDSISQEFIIFWSNLAIAQKLFLFLLQLGI